MNRRHFTTTLAATLAASLRAATPPGKPPRILLRSSWQTVNIGDIAHTPGVLALLAKHLPEAEVRLWPMHVDRGVAEMLRKRFPKLRIVQGAEDLQNSFRECDFLLHGSGPSLVAQRDVQRWHSETNKPFGTYGITLSSTTPELKTLLSHARFVFFRDSVSLAKANADGVTCPIMEFGPDGAFACDLRDDERADAFLQANKLKPGKFLCCIPRLRHTPYWLIKEHTKLDPVKEARNEEMADHDHAPLREAIIAVLRETDFKILLCPEDMTQMQVGKRWILDKLPADLRHRVVWREEFWLTDQALSTYSRSAGLFGLEMHSPIMCIGNGIPAIVCRFAEQTSKGFMWRDIGLPDWLFNFDEDPDLQKLAPAVLAMINDPAATAKKVAQARAFVEKRQSETMTILQQQSQQP